MLLLLLMQSVGPGDETTNQNRWLSLFSISLYAISADTIDGSRGDDGANRSADVIESTVDTAAVDVICWSWRRDDESKSIALSLSMLLPRIQSMDPEVMMVRIDPRIQSNQQLMRLLMQSVWTGDGDGNITANQSADIIKSTVDVAATAAAAAATTAIEAAVEAIC